MKTLYVSDLDGTLLRSDERTSDFTNNAIQQLKAMFNCEKVVVFGDGKNDIDMFEIADEGYAVSNAHETLKEKATGIIGSNDEDGVAKWLEQNKM